MGTKRKATVVIPSFINPIAAKMDIHRIVVGICALTCDLVKTRTQIRLWILKMPVRSLLQILIHLWDMAQTSGNVFALYASSINCFMIDSGVTDHVRNSSQ